MAIPYSDTSTNILPVMICFTASAGDTGTDFSARGRTQLVKIDRLVLFRRLKIFFCKRNALLSLRFRFLIDKTEILCYS